LEYQARKTVHGHGAGNLKNDPGLSSLSKVVFCRRSAARVLWVCNNKLDSQWLKDQNALEDWRSDSFQLTADQVREKFGGKITLEDRSLFRQAVVDGKKAEKQIMIYIDGLTTTFNRSSPLPVDANSSSRSPSTVFTHSSDSPHPTSFPVPDANDFEALGHDYVKRVNATLRHMCTESYCLRKGECRFSYPRDISLTKTLTFTALKDGTARVSLFTVRNDRWLDSHSEVQFQDFGGCNCDFQMIFDVGCVAR
jgi:hypothetical protein